MEDTFEIADLVRKATEALLDDEEGAALFLASLAIVRQNSQILVGLSKIRQELRTLKEGGDG